MHAHIIRCNDMNVRVFIGHEEAAYQALEEEKESHMNQELSLKGTAHRVHYIERYENTYIWHIDSVLVTMDSSGD